MSKICTALPRKERGGGGANQRERAFFLAHHLLLVFSFARFFFFGNLLFLPYGPIFGAIVQQQLFASTDSGNADHTNHKLATFTSLDVSTASTKGGKIRDRNREWNALSTGGQTLDPKPRKYEKKIYIYI